ncbi:MAG: hypothetical protein Q9182_004399 [Xanthomendoza sp. 2 TL-2023]
MPGLRSVAQETYVCLRCQLRLTIISTKPHRTLQEPPKKSQSRTFSTRPRHFQELANNDNDYPNDPTLFEDDATPAVKLGQQSDDIKLPDDSSPDSSSKSGHHFRRPNLYSKDALGLTTLGKPAEVLRIKDLPIPRFKDWWQLETHDGKQPSLTVPLTSSDIIKRLDAERGLVSTVRASRNIEQLKQDWLSSLKHQDSPTESEYNALDRQLHDGFTTKQLTAYLKDFHASVSTSILDLSGSFTSASLTRSEWRTATTPFPGDAWDRLQKLIEEKDPRDISPVSGDYTLFAESKRSGDSVKHLLVNKILRLCWKIKPREELDSVGEVDFMIPETHLKLLASHRRNILQQLAVEYDAKIDFSKLENIARLTANQTTCASSLKLLLMVLDEVTCHEVTLNESGGLWPKAVDYQALFNDPLLREVERLSSTVIRWSKSGNATTPSPKKLLVYSMGNDKKSLDDARGLIQQACRPSLSRATGAFYGGQSDASAKPSPVPVAGTNSIPLTDRGTEWTRMSLVKNVQETPKPARSYPLTAMKAVEEHTQAPPALMKIDNCVPTHPHWTTRLFQKTSVVLGQVLYPAKTLESIDLSDSRLDALINNSRSAFDTNVPGITKTLELQSFRTHVMEELRVHLKATTISNTEGNDTLEPPDLELSFPALPFILNREVARQSIRLILKDQQADLLLPHEPLDLRVATKIFVKATANLDPRIVEFINNITFDTWGEGGTDRKFETPKRLTIGVPEQFLSWGNKGSNDKLGDEEVQVEYSFAGIEHHHIVRGRVRPRLRCGPDHKPRATMADLSFSIIDAGPIGGRRQEVCYFDDRPLEFVGAGRAKKSKIQRLYNCASDLIRKIENRRFDIAHNVRRSHSSPTAGNVDEAEKARGRRHVRTRTVLSDVPMGSEEEERLMEGPSRVRVRKCIFKDGEPRKAYGIVSRKLASAKQA